MSKVSYSQRIVFVGKAHPHYYFFTILVSSIRNKRSILFSFTQAEKYVFDTHSTISLTKTKKTGDL